MPDSGPNTLAADAKAATGRRGDVPERLRRRFVTEERLGLGLGFYTDAGVTRPAFRDHGGRLTTDRNDPNVIRDLVAIARHRNWTAIQVSGELSFRREVWTIARQAGLEVRGYRPTERDRQAADRGAEPWRSNRPDRRDQGDRPPGAMDEDLRRRVVEAVIRDRIVEPGRQAQALATARARLSRFLERQENGRRAERERG